MSRKFGFGSLIVGVVVASASVSNAALVVYEGFDYTAGTLPTNNGGTGFTGSWEAFGATGVGGSVDWTVAAGSMVQGTNQLPIAGNKASAGNNSGASRKWFTPGAGRPSYLQTGGEIWFSANAKTLNTHQNSDSVLAITHQNNGAGNALGLVMKRVGTSNVNTGIGLRIGGSSAAVVDTLLPSETEVFVVGRVQFGTPSATLTVWLNPAADPLTLTPLTSATTSGTLGGDGTNYSQFLTQGALGMRTFSNGAAAFDEIRIGEFASDVMVIPEPASLGIVGGIGAMLMRRRRNV